MRFSTAFPILSAALSLLSSVAAVPSAAPAPAPAPAATNGTHELNERTFYIPPGYELCANVADSYYRGRFDFGCLCISDVPDFVRNNGISPTVGALIQVYIYSHGSLNKYPDNAQPTCDGYGGFTCGSLKRVGNKCQATSCPPNTCSSNGGCCPRGQTYHNGQCCASQGCDRSGPKCTPVYQCRKDQFRSNNICCDNAGWIGLETICCPPGQVEKDKMCGCPTGQKKNPKNANQCISSCDKPNWEYSMDKCCPPGSEQSRNGGACVCTDDQETLSSDGQTCVSKCGSKTNWHFYVSKCCPPGATEDRLGNCACTNSQEMLSSDKQSCVPRCGSKTTWTFHETKCCPPGADENRYHQCVCTDSRQELSDDGQSCVNKCEVPSWNHCRTKCCPPGSDEDDNKNCVCTDPQQVLSADKKSCVDRCPKADEDYRESKCCKKFLVQKGDQCVCPNVSDKIYGNQCVPKCEKDENYKPATGGKPEYCEPKCDEAAGYVFSTSKWNTNGRCCKRGMTACETICCPNGQSEAAPGRCCPIGSTWDGHKCVAPTHVPAKKALTGRAERKAQLGFTGMESNKKNELCPVGLAACLIPGTLTNEYECLDAMNDLQSCGGCTSMGTGQDCTAIKGAKWMGCNAGQCEVYSCRAGFKRVDGNKCVAL